MCLIHSGNSIQCPYLIVPVGELGGDELNAPSVDGMLMLRGLMLLDLTGEDGRTAPSESGESGMREANCSRMLVLGKRMLHLKIIETLIKIRIDC